MMHGHCGIPERVQWLQNLANVSLGFKVERRVKLQQNENDSKRTSNELLKISKDSNESLRAGWMHFQLPNARCHHYKFSR